MFRLLSKNVKKDNNITISTSEKSILLDRDVWENGRKLFKYGGGYFGLATVQVVPVTNFDKELIGYAYQDIESNRELRMLRELEEAELAFQFKDIFPDINKVVVHDCNELAYAFVKYLERQSIRVEVTGNYWEYFGYSSDHLFDENENTLVIYAEGTTPRPCDLYYNMIHSVSPEFECIDKIYEKNVLEGRIKDTEGDFKWLLKQLERKDIIIVGTDRTAQDVYDLLCENGIEISGFLRTNYKNWHTDDPDARLKRKWGDREYNSLQEALLLGKKIFHLTEAIQYFNNPVFINCMDKNSALGTRDVEVLDYYGYQRNKGVFLIADYTDVPHSNLIHIMRNKNVLLAGDEGLCHMLIEYLIKVEEGNINVCYTDLSEDITYKEGSILCLVKLWFGRYGGFDEQQNDELLFDKLHDSGFCGYTEYFSSIKSFSVIEQYLQNHVDKYSVCELIPKGIVLAKVGPGGNSFTDGIMDGHPNILMMPVGAFCNNLFLYCIRLARLRAQDIMAEFWRLFIEEATRIRVQVEFLDKEQFEKSAQKLLCFKERFTSQELFVIFHIAYGEMINKGKRIDISQKMIYWEPHFVQRAQFTYLAAWLESNKFKGYSLVVRRDNCIWMGSLCRRMEEDGFRNLMQPFEYMFWTSSELDENLPLIYWEEFKLRFEDMKLRPKENLLKICEKLEIPWSDTMLHTTAAGKMVGYRGSVDFDLKPVFNKYEDYLSEFDRFRIAITCRAYQKRYGYTYESCIKFSKRELQDMFLRKFRFQENIPFESQIAKTEYFLTVYELIRWELWEVYKRERFSDVYPEFERLEAGQQVQKCNAYVNELRNRVNKAAWNIRIPERARVIELINKQEKLVLYGTGRDCKEILKYADENAKQAFLFSDKRAAGEEYYYCDKKVIAPYELLDRYAEYKILITSSRYYKLIRYELEKIGIEENRIFCNTVQFWDD